MKIFLVTSSAPYLGTEQHYAAYADNSESVFEYLYEEWWPLECQDLYDSYAFRCEDGWEEEWEEMDEDSKSEYYHNDYNAFMSEKYDEWCENCNLELREVKSEEELDDYVPGGEGHLEIVYDERQ